MKLEGGAIFKIAAEKNFKAEEVKKKIQAERAQAVKTLRKIKTFGYTGSNGAAFEWPT